MHGLVWNAYRAQGLTVPIAVGIPIALNVYKIGDSEGPPDYPVGRPLRDFD